MDFGEMVTVARVVTSSMSLLTFMLFAMEAAVYREKNKQFDVAMKDAESLRNRARDSLKKARMLEEKAERDARREERHKLTELHTARKYGAEYIRKPMREARIIPGTRNEETTRLFADGVAVEFESVISYEAELEGELIKVVESA